MNLEFRASGVPLIGVLIANGKAQAVTDTKLGQLARHRRRHHPGRHGPAAWPLPACTKRSSSWWVTTKPGCSKRPSRMGGPFLLFR